MKKIILIFSVLLLFVSSSHADNFFNLFNKRAIKGSGDIVTIERDIDEFTRLKSKGSFDINIEVGQKASLKITFDDNLIEFIETDTRGKTLEVSSEESFRSKYNCVIDITVTNLNDVRLTGSGDILITDIDADIFEITLAGSGDIIADGKAEEVEISVSGSGDIDARDLEAQEAYVKVSGSGDIKVFASEQLNARVSGSGDIAYYGNPEDVSKHVSGSGSIRKKKR